MKNDIDIATYADDNTPDFIGDNIDYFIKSLEKASTALFPWFDNDLFKSNTEKCHLLISSIENLIVHVSESEIENNKCQKLLDWKLNFNVHISDICEKASGKLYVLARIASLISLSKGRIPMNAIFNSQFSYCPLIWMCYSRTNKKIIA